ncbi:hypothetical protein [Heyndrickxia camelliae]|uniref:Uncharacterized protein n=1 Tax=Heyndrickxia camelliae TaxID=1707093 RepID=A0A2N3LGU3_9BACI|nr:hypothetical protein [Heyndrickxia camelliae]PKR83787.1 hypothetical protein CWO92_17410 [Heyndrickxia camelliae]
MAKTKAKKQSMSILRILWIILIVILAIIIVYLYRLQTQGQLLNTLLKTTGSIMNFIEKDPRVAYVLLSYIPIFYLGYKTGKAKK